MTSLRARIAALLIVAILTVVGLATLAASRALHPPSPQATIEPVARQIHVLAKLAVDDPDLLQAAGGIVQGQPARGDVHHRLSRFLSHALERTGEDLSAHVSRSGNAAELTASIDLGTEGWLIAPVPDFSPPNDQWVIFAIWIVMIVLGSGAIALYAAHRLSRPLELLENAARRIGADATLAHIPEAGSVEVRATARALNQLSDRLATAMESRMRLVAAAGHDLRTPMTRMRLRAEFIEDDEEREKWLADLEELDLIADSAIRLVREEASRDEPEPLRLDLLLHETATEMEELRYPVHLGDLTEVTVRAGPLALKRALRNLMVNAATHGGGAEILLEIRREMAVVTITDEGPGIPEELIGQVFEPFFRIDPARRKTIPGAGLGLAIAREIVERYGGKICIANMPHRGLKQQVHLLSAGSLYSHKHAKADF